MSRILLDTNALVDLCVNRVPKRHAAMMEMLALLDSPDDAVLVPAPSLKDATYIIENSAPFKQVVPERAERMGLARRMRDAVFMQCEVVAVDAAVARRAHRNRDEKDYDDALVAECALASGADVIISSDKSAFENARVPKATPEEFAAHLRLLRRR